jgi:hypothetical protein
MNADGSELRRSPTTRNATADVVAVSPINEIAYAAQTGAGYDIKVYDVAYGVSRTITDGIGSNESPAFSAERAPHRVHARRAPARNRSSPSIAMARTCARLPGPA